jgi:hypothetical protein
LDIQNIICIFTYKEIKIKVMDIEVLADKYEEMENLKNQINNEEMDINNLFDELVFLSQKRDELWEYHPLNPEGKNLIKTVKELSERIDQINDQLISQVKEK